MQDKFNFEMMLKKVRKTVVGHVTERKQYLFTIINGEIPDALIGDELMLACILDNLLLYAVETTPKGGKITMLTDLANKTDDSTFLQVNITSEYDPQEIEQAEFGGGGIHNETCLRIAISKYIIELLGGKWTESSSENGMDFTFALRIKRE